MQEKKNKKANKKGGVRKEDLEMQQQKEKRNGAEMLSEYALSRLTYNCIWSAKKKRRKRKRRERERKKNYIYWKQKALTRIKKKKSSRRVAIWKKKETKKHARVTAHSSAMSAINRQNETRRLRGRRLPRRV